MVIASKNTSKHKGLRSSNRYRKCRKKVTAHKVKPKDPVYNHLFKILTHEKKKNGGKIPRGFIPKLTRKYDVYTFLNVKGLTKRYSRFCQRSKFIFKFNMEDT